MPFVLEGEFPEVVMGGPRGVRFKVCHIGFDQGAVELFEFLEPVHPIDVVHPSRGNLIHFGLQVEDVEEALERVEAAGGRRLGPGSIRGAPPASSTSPTPTRTSSS